VSAVNWEQASTIVQAGSAVVVAWFAGQQIYIHRRDRRERLRTAFAVIFAEFWRLSSIHATWDHYGPTELACQGALVPDDLLPREWTSIVKMLGEVSSDTAMGGAIAYQGVGDAALFARQLVYRVDRDPADSKIAELDKDIRRHLSDAVDLYADALRSAPPWLKDHPVGLSDPISRMGKVIQRGIVNDKVALMQPRLHRRRFGKSGTWSAGILTRLAAWLDPSVW
jgi:hypothetical protein